MFWDSDYLIFHVQYWSTSMSWTRLPRLSESRRRLYMLCIMRYFSSFGLNIWSWLPSHSCLRTKEIWKNFTNFLVRPGHHSWHYVTQDSAHRSRYSYGTNKWSILSTTTVLSLKSFKYTVGMNRDGMALACKLQQLDAEVRRRLWCESSQAIHIHIILTIVFSQGLYLF